MKILHIFLSNLIFVLNAFSEKKLHENSKLIIKNTKVVFSELPYGIQRKRTFRYPIIINDLPEKTLINIRLLSKHALSKYFTGNSKHRTVAYCDVCDDSSIESTSKIPYKTELQKKSNKNLCLFYPYLYKSTFLFLYISFFKNFIPIFSAILIDGLFSSSISAKNSQISLLIA